MMTLTEAKAIALLYAFLIGLVVGFICGRVTTWRKNRP